MKKLLVLILIIPSLAFAQADNVGIGTNTPDPSAVLDITSNNRGVLLPRLTDTNSVSSPADALIIFQEIDSTFYYYDGIRWRKFGKASIGPTGPQGPAGPAGSDGAPGVMGPTGPTGMDGTSGDRYSSCITSTHTIALGIMNITIDTGLAYTPGQTVIIAFDASNKMEGDVISYNPTTGALQVNVTNITGSGSYSTWCVNLAGAPGPQGPTGPQGIQGIAGTTGPTGPQGVQGIQGPAGVAGADGATGPTGPQGIQGVAGANGATGPTGPQGIQGPAGPVGCGNNNYLVKSNGTSAICSQVYDDGVNVGIGTSSPTYKLHVMGRLKTNGVNETSDARLKTNIENIEDALATIQKLQGVTYQWDLEKFPDKGLDDKEQMGLIAQDLRKVLPELVDEDDQGYLSIRYTQLIGLLIEAVKEQQIIIDSQQSTMVEMDANRTSMQEEMKLLNQRLLTIEKLLDLQTKND